MKRHKWELSYDAIVGRKLTNEERKQHHSEKLPKPGSALKAPLIGKQGNGWKGNEPPEWVQKAFKDLAGFRTELKQRHDEQKAKSGSKDTAQATDKSQADPVQHSAPLMRVDKRLRNQKEEVKKPQEELPLWFVQKHERLVTSVSFLKTVDPAMYNKLLAMYRAETAQKAEADTTHADHKKSENDDLQKEITKDITGMDVDHGSESKNNKKGSSDAEPKTSTSEGSSESSEKQGPEHVGDAAPAPRKPPS